MHQRFSRGRRLLQGTLEFVTLAGFVACGRLSETPVDAGGSSGSGGTVGTGGLSGTGAGTAGGAVPGVGASSGKGASLGVGAGISVGGGVLVDPGLPADEACGGIPEGLLDPPCSDEDIVVPTFCWLGSVDVLVPLFDVGVPATNLSAQLLPQGKIPGGEGGEGGALEEPPLALAPSLLPPHAGTTTGNEFSLDEPGVELLLTIHVEDLAQKGYFQEVRGEQDYYPHYVGTLLLTQADRIVFEKRLIIEPPRPCLVK